MKWLIFVLLRLILAHAPNGDEIEINPVEVSSIRAPRDAEGNFPKEVDCVLVMTNGKVIGVLEDCRTMKLMIEAAEEKR